MHCVITDGLDSCPTHCRIGNTAWTYYSSQWFADSVYQGVLCRYHEWLRLCFKVRVPGSKKFEDVYYRIPGPRKRITQVEVQFQAQH